MKKTNFLKGLALAAVALVSGFATSCSEEELSIKNNPVELPAASASVSISVVDLEEGKLIGSVTTLDATASIGGTLTVECPANAGYTTAAPVAVSIPALQKGQSVNVPVTFYVVTLESALADLMYDTYFTFSKEDLANVEITKTLMAFVDKSEGWNGYVAANTDDTSILNVWGAWAYKDGWEFISEVGSTEEEEETEEVAVSRAAETTVLELIKLVKPKEYTWYNNWVIDPMTALTVSPNQYIYKGVCSLMKNGEEEAILKFVGNQYTWGVNWSFEAITHDAPSHDGHDGHGHGGNSNAGGGTGDDAGE